MEEALSDKDDKSCGDENSCVGSPGDANQNDKKLTGRWTKDEHQRFVDGLKKFGKNWKKVEEYVGTRTGAQIRSHAQKFFNKLQRELNSNPEDQQFQESISIETGLKQEKEFQNEIDISVMSLPSLAMQTTNMTQEPFMPQQSVLSNSIKQGYINNVIIGNNVISQIPQSSSSNHQINEDDIVEVSTNLNTMIKRIQCGESIHKKEEIISCRNFLDEYLEKICKNIDESSTIKPIKDDEKRQLEKNISLLENLRSILMDTKSKLEQLGSGQRKRNGSFYMSAPDDIFSLENHDISQIDLVHLQKPRLHQNFNSSSIFTVHTTGGGYQLQTKLQTQNIDQKRIKSMHSHYPNSFDDPRMDNIEDLEPITEKKIKTLQKSLFEQPTQKVVNPNNQAIPSHIFYNNKRLIIMQI